MQVDAGEWQQTKEEGTDGSREAGGVDAATKAAEHGGMTRAVRFKTPLHVRLLRRRSSHIYLTRLFLWSSDWC